MMEDRALESFFCIASGFEYDLGIVRAKFLREFLLDIDGH